MKSIPDLKTLSVTLCLCFMTLSLAFGQTDKSNNIEREEYFDRTDTEAPELQFIKTFVWAFTKYVKWPESGDKTFDIGILEEMTLYDYMMKLKERYGDVKGKEIQVHKLKDLSRAAEMEVLMIPPESSFSKNEIYKAVGDRPVLIVSENRPVGDFMINFIIVDDKIKFEISRKLIEQNALIVNDVLTDLGIVVD